jgi:hypothetical protein
MLLGLLVVGVSVGVEFEGELAIGRFELIFGGVPVDPQDFVIIPFARHKISQAMN